MTNKYIAHITIEADTPLKVGSNSSDFLQDSPIQKDWNALPMILGTSLAGVLRKHYRDVYDNDDLFGFQRKSKETDLSEGSRVILSNALLLDEDKKVNEGLLTNKSSFLQLFDNLPIREHTKIDHRGVTGSSKVYSKFDEEVVYKGTQFKFCLEVLGDEEAFERLLTLLKSPAFRLGGGTTKGFGKFNVLAMETTIIDSSDKLLVYNSSLNTQLAHSSSVNLTTSIAEKHTSYILQITPEDFFMFGAGFGDEDADQTPVYEKTIVYNAKESGLSKDEILIPASSIKGALSHRTAFYYNLSNGVYADTIDKKDYENHTGEKNCAVKAVFGHKKELDKESKKELGQKGKILISDCFKNIKDNHTKTFDHVAIDRFTGGAIDGALFQEKTIAQKDTWEIEILLEKSVDAPFLDAFEKSLDDVCTGMLALGGATTKGHGVFEGNVLKDGEVLNVSR